MSKNEIRVFGPPGTGKTTTMAAMIGDAIQKHGPEAVLVTSFTRAAAAEIGGRDIDGVKAATLHSHCWRALDRPEIAETYISSSKNEKITPWNACYPHLTMSAQKIDTDADIPEMGDAPGDELMAEAQRLRGMLIPRDRWSNAMAVHFSELWDDWKSQNGLSDFTDLIERCLVEVPYAPGGASIGFVDEAQDMTPLQMKLIRRWGQWMNTLVMAGDDDQILYAWAGATPEAFLEPALPPEQMRVLSQSRRIPRAVHERAERWIGQIGVRQPKAYNPRDEEGVVARTGATWTAPEALLEALGNRSGHSKMVLASCGYMLDPLLKLMRAEGIPFWNQYRLKAGHWNPLGSAGPGKVSATERLLAFLRFDEGTWGASSRTWTGRELAMWVAALNAKGVLHHGAKKAIEDIDTHDEPLSWDDLATWFTDDAMGHMFDCDLDWFEENLLSARKRGMSFPLQVTRKRGGAALLERPEITIGTIHSVKGGEASSVFLFPDLSQRGFWEGWHGPRAAQDNVRRLAYVGMTRASRALVLCSPASQMAWGDM